jgi:hypothetical protein
MFAMARAMRCEEGDVGDFTHQLPPEAHWTPFGAPGGCKRNHPLQRKKEFLREFVRRFRRIAALSRVRPIEAVFLPPFPVFRKLLGFRELSPRGILAQKTLEGPTSRSFR